MIHDDERLEIGYYLMKGNTWYDVGGIIHSWEGVLKYATVVKFHFG